MLAPTEEILEGRWTAEGGQVKADATEQRIGALIEGRLKLLANDPVAGAWHQLYLDPSDGRLWELTYPQGEMHGGGPRLLRVISRSKAEEHFKWEA